MRLDRAIDRYIGDLARQGRSRRTRDDYWRKLIGLTKFRKGVLFEADVADVTDDHCRMYLDQWRDKSPGTIAHSVSVLNGFSAGRTTTT